MSYIISVIFNGNAKFKVHDIKPIMCTKTFQSNTNDVSFMYICQSLFCRYSIFFSFAIFDASYLNSFYSYWILSFLLIISRLRVLFLSSRMNFGVNLSVCDMIDLDNTPWNMVNSNSKKIECRLKRPITSRSRKKKRTNQTKEFKSGSMVTM